MFGSTEELVDLCRRALARPRRGPTACARPGVRRTLAEHTFDHRVAGAGGVVGLRFDRRPGRLAALAGAPAPAAAACGRRRRAAPPPRRRRGGTPRRARAPTCWSPSTRRTPRPRSRCSSAAAPRAVPASAVLAPHACAPSRVPACRSTGAVRPGHEPRSLGEPRAVLAAGHYTAIGAGAHALARQRRVAVRGRPARPAHPGRAAAARRTRTCSPGRRRRRGVLAQRPRRRDARRWSARSCSGRPLTGCRGRATRRPPRSTSASCTRAELSRSRLARAATAFCRDHDATYRPHPSERDRLSRLLHAPGGDAASACDDGTCRWPT